MRLFFSILLVFLLSGCVATSKQFDKHRRVNESHHDSVMDVFRSLDRQLKLNAIDVDLSPQMAQAEDTYSEVSREAKEPSGFQLGEVISAAIIKALEMAIEALKAYLMAACGGTAGLAAIVFAIKRHLNLKKTARILRDQDPEEARKTASEHGL